MKENCQGRQEVSPQASGKKGHCHEKMFTLHCCLVRKGLHTYFKGRKWKLREIQWLGQGHTAWKRQNLTLMTPRNEPSVLVTGSLRLELRKSMGRWDCSAEVRGHCLQGEAQRDKPGVLHLGEVTNKRWGLSEVSKLCVLNPGLSTGKEVRQFLWEQ